MSDWARGVAGGILLLANFVAILALAASPYFGFLTAFIISGALTYLVILIHELGHAGAVWWLRGRVLILAVGPLAARFHPFSLGGTPELAQDDRELGGFVVSTFDGAETTRKDIIVAIAGPLANLASAALIGVALPALTPGHVPAADPTLIAVEQSVPSNAPYQVALPTDADVQRALRAERAREIKGLWTPLVSALLLLSGAAGIANLIPFRGSDGDHIRRALRDMGEVRRYRRRRDAG